jgi:hypothetical protein
MQRQHTGRPDSRVIPTGWSENHAPVVDRTLASTVQIGPAGTVPGWNEGRGQSESVGLPAVYDGPASLMVVSDTARALLVVEDPYKCRVYDVTPPLARTGAALVVVGHEITVTACDDADLEGKRLRVAAIERGTRRFSRVLLATLLD